MGFDRKGNEVVKKDNNFTLEELNFIVNKLRKSTYTGDEFEIFYRVMKKLENYSK